MLLEELDAAAGLEEKEVEWKARLNREDVVGWLKTVAGFANASGGVLYIGVEDKSGKLIGFDRKEADNERNYFNNQVNEHLFPRPEMSASFLRYTVRKKEFFVIKVTVPESSLKPVVLKYKGIPSIFMRRDGYTNGATYEEIIRMSRESQGIQYDAVVTDQLYSRDDFQDLLAFFSEHRAGAVLTDKALASLGFFNKDRYLTNAGVMFRDGYDGQKTLVQCAVFSGLNKGSDKIISVNRFSGNITGSIKFMDEFVRTRMNHSVIKQAESHIDLDAYPRRALFEGIINAVAHRDYYLDGTQIQIDMFRDRLEISSPGSFYQGGKLDVTYDLSSIISKRRNELIAGILVECDVMEAAGTGFDKIIEEYREADDPHRPYIFSTSDQFTLVLPDLTYEPGVLNTKLRLEYSPVPDGSAYDDAILAYCYGTDRKAAEIAEQIHVSNSTYFRRSILQKLVDHGYLDTHKKGRSVYYRTNSSVVRRA